MVALLTILASPTLAQETERVVTFPEAVNLLGRNNLSLLLSKSQAEEQEALALQAAAYLNPSLSLTHEPLYGDGSSFSESYFNVIQPIEWRGLRNARINAARQLAQSAESRLRADSLRLLFELAKTYIEASTTANKQQHILHITEIFRAAGRSAEEQYASGEMSGYDVRRLKIERARYENRLALSELELHRTQRRLAMLILPEEQGIRAIPSTDLVVPKTPLDMDAALEHASIHRAELNSALADVEAAHFSITGIKKETVPAPILTAGYKRQSNGFNGLFLGTLFDLPIFDRQQGSIAAATSRLYQAETRLLIAQLLIEQDVRQTYDIFTSLNNRIAVISDDLLADSEGLLTAAQTSYAEGEISLLELLDASDAFYDAQLTTHTLRASLLVAYYDFMRATGHILLN